MEVAVRRDALALTEEYVKEQLGADTSGHDWWHVHRVRQLAVVIAREEGANESLVELAALLHDISDAKLNGGDKEKGPRLSKEWVLSLGGGVELASTVAQIVKESTFKGAGVLDKGSSLESRIVQDADRLDALGAIGIARAFAYGAYAGQQMYDPGVDPVYHSTEEEYRARSGGTTVNHFYEKLLLLRDRMNTDAARRIADRRHEYMERFLEQFYREWRGES